MSLINRLFSGASDIAPEEAGHTVSIGTDGVHVYNATWIIPESIGGMTTAALRRIRSFQAYGHSLSQTLLTFSPRMDVDAAKARLISEGRINDDVALVNIWQDLRGRNDSEFAILGGMTPEDPIPKPEGEVERITEFYDRFRDPLTDKTIRREYLRSDGSLLLVDVQDPKIGRRFVLHSAAGNPISEWRRPRDFYNDWIEATVSKEPAVLIVDDKRISEFVHEISNRAFALILFMHGSHLRRPWNGDHGELHVRRVETMRNFDRFDMVGVQTQQQGDAIKARGISGANIKLLTGELPSGSVLSEAPTDRPIQSAVMIANLIPLKRVDHAIRAVALLKDRGVDITLTVLGEGAERQKLETLISDLKVDDRIEMPGYVNDVPTRLQSVSFSMLTSTSEGLPLSTMESMGAGCVPIVYDITYGPQDLVEQGRNGFITPWGDIGALADQIENFLGFEPERIASMRAAALETVERYLPEAGYRRWKTALENLETVPLPDVEPRDIGKTITTRALNIVPNAHGARLELEFRHLHASTASTLQLVLAGRKLNSYFLCAEPIVEGRQFGRGTTITFYVDAEKFSESGDEIFDVYLRRPHDPWNAKRRIGTPKNYRPATASTREWYPTKHGNLSVRFRP